MNDWDDIRFFLSVARTGSFSGAARELAVTHSTVSRRIQSLEAKHGVKLFTQTPAGYEMSEAAEAIFENAERIEADHQQISRMLYGQDSRLEGKVSLTMPHDLFEYILAPSLADFFAEHPALQLNLSLFDGLRDLAALEADLAVRLSMAPPEDLIGRRVLDLHGALYVSKTYDMHGSVGVILWDEEEVMPDWVIQTFPDAHVALRLDQLSGMYAAIKAGFGVGYLPCYLPDSRQEECIVKLPHKVSSKDWGVWVLNHADLRKSARVTRTRQVIIDALKQKADLFQGASV